MVGIVVVSHSASLAEGVAEVAREMGGAGVQIETAGGLDEPGRPLGTDAVRVIRAIERVYSDDGVLVLMDLGSAVLSAEMALDMLPSEQREAVLLCEAPLVEGAVAAAVTARLGASLAQVAAEARDGLKPKVAHLATEAPELDGRPPAAAEDEGAEAPTIRLPVRNPLGLHARPAARFVQTASAFDAEVFVTNETAARGPASARSLNALATLGVRQDDEIAVSARGPQAEQALRALQALAERDFDDAAPALVSAVPRADAPSGVPAADDALSGLAASPGIAFGDARHLHVGELEVPAGPGGEPQEEWEALLAALARVRAELEETRRSLAAQAGEYHAAIFDAHLLFLEDEALLEPTRHRIFDEGEGAASAWIAVAEATGAEYRGLGNAYVEARADDLAAVARRVLAYLVGRGHERPAVAGPGIVVAPDLSPAETAGLDRKLVRGIVTAYGGPTSHSAILARSLGIPAAVAVGEEVLSLPEGTPLLLDGDAGTVYVRPPADVTTRYAAEARARERRERRMRTAAHEPAVTRDGVRIEVAANAGSEDDALAAVAAGADAVGLLRTEFLFLDRDALPDPEEQYRVYRRMAEALDGRPLILRTLDVGADKPLPYLPRPVEANPFLGARGIRLALAEPELLEGQLRAAIRVAAEFPVKVMFPMVATLDEYRAAAAVARSARDSLAAAGVPVPARVDLGVMVEVPATALLAEAFAAEVAFFSVGTNDLAQYTLAAERGNERVASLGDALHPSVLRLIHTVASAAEQHGTWAGVCGELAGDPAAVPVLVGLGVRELSVSPPLVPAVKQAVRELTLTDARDLARTAMRLDSAAAVRALIGGGDAVVGGGDAVVGADGASGPSPTPS